MKNKNLSGLKTKLALFTIIGSLFGLSYVLTSCASSEIADSGDVNQAKIHQYYSVSFDANDGKSYKVESQFRFGGNKGTTLRLTDPSMVYVNDVEMKEESNVLRGCYYTSSLNDGNTFKFKFVDTEDKEYINECKVLKVELKPIHEIIIGKDYKIKWIGMPLMANEVMECVIEDNEGNTATAKSDIVGSESVKLKTSEMSQLVQGEGQIYLKRSKFVDVDQAADDGGSIYTEYKTKVLPLEITNTNKE